jgi:hypothetical protein
MGLFNHRATLSIDYGLEEATGSNAFTCGQFPRVKRFTHRMDKRYPEKLLAGGWFLSLSSRYSL